MLCRPFGVCGSKIFILSRMDLHGFFGLYVTNIFLTTDMDM